MSEAIALVSAAVSAIAGLLMIIREVGRGARAFRRRRRIGRDVIQKPIAESTRHPSWSARPAPATAPVEEAEIIDPHDAPTDVGHARPHDENCGWPEAEKAES